MAQHIIITDDTGNIWRVERDVVLPILERHHVPLPPCPDGWSRLDYMYGADEDCAVPVMMREASNWFMIITFSAFTALMARKQWRRLNRGQTHKPLYRAMSRMVAATLGATLHNVSSKAELSHTWTMALFSMSSILFTEALIRMSEAFLNNAIDTMHALEPARSALWRGRLALALDAIYPCFMTAQIWGILRWVGQHNGDGHIDFVFAVFGSNAVISLLLSVIMFLGSIGTARTARILGASIETQQLRHRLWRQSKSAKFLTIIFLCVCFGTVLCSTIGTRVIGVLVSFCYGAVLLISILRYTSTRGIARSNGRIASKSAVVPGCDKAQGAPERRISAVEGVALAPAAIEPSRVPLTRRGVSLAFLRAFIEQKHIGARMSTAEVCERVIKPATAGASCAYHDLVHSQEHTIATSIDPQAHKPVEREGWLGESSYFLSHSWSYPFRQLIAIIESFEEQTKPEHTVYYWFDIFVMNQHSTVDMHALFPNLQASVRSAGRLLLAVDSWREPAPLARVWCLLEIFTAITEKAELVLCFSSAEQASFAEKLAQNQVEVQRTLEAVDAEQAEATVAADREMIFALIRRGTGFSNFNDTIRLALRNSFERVAIAQRQL